jgi:hypothetical protein
MRRWILPIAGLAVVGLAVGVVAYYLWWKPTHVHKNGDDPKPSEPVTFLDNGLTSEDRKVFYHLAEGSEVYPLDWLRVTKRKGSDKFFLDDMERFGLLPDPDSKENLPVGLTAAVTRGLAPLGKMTGINCAACHVGQISYKGKALRIDGAPNVFDGNSFFTELVEAGKNILSSPEELIGFLHRLEGDPLKGQRKPLVDRLLAHLAKDESDLKKAFLKRVDRVVKDAQAAPVASWSMKPGADADAARKKLLEGVETKKEGEPSLAEAAKGAGSPLASHSEQDRQDAVSGTLDDVIVIVRLLVARVDFLKNLAHIGKGKPDWGFGRVDAFGSVIALYFNPEFVPNAPVSYPHLFAFYRNPWFHYDGNTTSVLQRNLGQALGVGAVFEPDTYSSTLRPLDSDKLERLASKLKVPAWPADFLGVPLDNDKVAKGKVLFEKHCVSCHPLIKPTDEAPDRLSELKEIGTDPLRATNVAEIMPKSKKPFYDDLKVVLDKVTKKALDDANVPPDKQAEFNHGRPVKWRTTQKYAQRPLWGVWATAPYLHNGSVPTLYDLLLPVKERPATFPLGHRDFDPVKVGYLTKVDKPRFTFDVSKDGNSNAGHEYGTTLSDAERYELIEFMKTL